MAADYVAKWQEETLFVKKLIGKDDEFKSVNSFLDFVWKFMHTWKDETITSQKALADLSKRSKDEFAKHSSNFSLVNERLTNLESKLSEIS